MGYGGSTGSLLRRAIGVVVLFILISATGLAGAENRKFRLVLRAGGAETVLSLRDLAALPQHVIVTHTAYTDGLQRFEGPLLRDVVAKLGREGKGLRLLAADGDTAEIPWQDLQDYDVLAATTRNGRPMGPRELGPVWVVYPRDDFRELQAPRFDLRWIWQLSRIDVQ